MQVFYKYSGNPEVVNEKYVEYFIMKFVKACFSLQPKSLTGTNKEKSETKFKPVSVRKRSFEIIAESYSVLNIILQTL